MSFYTKTVFIFVVWMLPALGFAQLHDNTWLLGYSNNQDTTDKYGVSALTFDGGNVLIQQNPKISLEFIGSNSSFSDESGKLHSCSNTIHIETPNGEIMDGGEGLFAGALLPGDATNQNIISLPMYHQPNKYLYIYQNTDYLPEVLYCATQLLYSKIDKLKNDGKGAVIARNIMFMEDTLSTGGVITVVRHANGRDWWMLSNEIFTNKYYRILITPDTFLVIGSQSIGTNLQIGAGQSTFSPDGSHFANYYYISSQQGGYLEIYDFDRCTGLLSNHRSEHISNGSWGGVAFSPNSRFLYLNNTFEAYQYDFQAADVLASKVKIADWDGYHSPFPAAFYLMQLAPDGQIYSATPTGCDVLHVIHRPDEYGTACQFEQHAIHLPTYNARSMPNFPNYRLGPIDGSPCDTLGIDNLPVSWWRYERDTLDALSFEFRDNSWYEPTSWVWDFGDGGSSTERHPVHQFPSAGTYQVCLKVSNANGMDTRCKTVFAGVSAAVDPVLQSQIQITPNPFSDHLSIAVSTALHSPVFRLWDIYGRLITTTPVGMGMHDVNTARLGSGMYFYTIEAGGEMVKKGKVVKG